MKSSVLRVVALLLMLIPVGLTVTWLAARTYADKQYQHEQQMEKKRAGLASSTCKSLCTAALIYSQDHQGRLPPAATWEQALHPYLQKVSLQLPPAVDGKPRRFAMNRALGDQNTERLAQPTQVILFYESTITTPNAADDLTSLPAQDSRSGFVVGWADSHCYYMPAASRSNLIKQSADAMAVKSTSR